LIFVINILNYRYFHTDLSAFFKNKKKRWKKEGNVKTLFYNKKNTKEKRLQTFITTMRNIWSPRGMGQ